MNPKTNKSPESVVREIKRKTRRKFTPEERIRIILEGLKGEDSIAAICRREGIAPSLYYKWSKSFLEAGKRRLKGDPIREASSDEVTEIRKENDQLKQLVARGENCTRLPGKANWIKRTIIRPSFYFPHHGFIDFFRCTGKSAIYINHMLNISFPIKGGGMIIASMASGEPSGKSLSIVDELIIMRLLIRSGCSIAIV